MEDSVQLFAQTYHAAQTSKYITLVAATLIVYDFLTTLHVEVQYVWATRWAYGRIAFHFNRIWCTVVLSVFVLMNFTQDMSPKTCIKYLYWYTYGLIFLLYNITGMMIMRAWILYDRKKSVLAIMGLAQAAALTITIVVFGLHLREMTSVENPAPGVLSGCHFHVGADKRIQIAYASSFVLNTTIFVITVRRTWFLKRSGIRSPLITRLTQDGTLYYFVNLASITLSMLINKDHITKNIALGSGHLIALHSIMCSRMALSLRTFDRPNKTDTTDIPMTEVGDNTEWRAPSTVRIQGGPYVELEDGVKQSDGNSLKLSGKRLEARLERSTN